MRRALRAVARAVRGHDRQPVHRPRRRAGEGPGAQDGRRYPPTPHRRLGRRRHARRGDARSPVAADLPPSAERTAMAAPMPRHQHDGVDGNPACRSPMKSLAAIAGAAVDQLVGEPPIVLHPVARFGALMHRVERHVYADRRARGVAYAAVGVGVGVTAGLALRRTIGPTAATIAATTICAAGRMLDDEAMRISRRLQEGDVDTARRQVRSLVGRSTDHLDEHEISRAVIESVAENCVDAVTASLFWGSIGGAPAVLAHRAVNTLDAMVGHRDRPLRTIRVGERPTRRCGQLRSRTPHRPRRHGGSSASGPRHLARRAPRCPPAPFAQRRRHRGHLRRRARRSSGRREPVRRPRRRSRNSWRRTRTRTTRHRVGGSAATDRDHDLRAHAGRDRLGLPGHESPTRSLGEGSVGPGSRASGRRSSMPMTSHDPVAPGHRPDEHGAVLRSLGRDGRLLPDGPRSRRCVRERLVRRVRADRIVVSQHRRRLASDGRRGRRTRRHADLARSGSR